MAILADTNILLRSLYPDHSHYSAAQNALAALRSRGEVLCVAPQNLIEFWADTTRSRADNGLGMTTAKAASEITSLRRLFRLLPASQAVLDTWQRMVIDLGVSGKSAHDTHLAAVMQVYAITGILTFNGSDFRRFPGITVLDPLSF